MDNFKWQQPIDKLAPVVKEAQTKLCHAVPADRAVVALYLRDLVAPAPLELEETVKNGRRLLAARTQVQVAVAAVAVLLEHKA